MADVFISYHEKSAGELARQIAETLESGGISCWYAKRDIPTGDDFAEEIPPQIEKCKVFLLILNENAQASKHIRSEFGLAFSRFNRGEEITIFPVEIGDFEKKSWIKYYLVQLQTLKASVLDLKRMQELAQRVAKLLNHELKPLTQSASPTQIISHGKCGYNVTYALDENGVLTISGQGLIRNFEWNDEAKTYNTPWWNKRRMISHVEIEDGITAIGTGAFYDCSSLTSVTIPDSVTFIGILSFRECRGLISVSIPGNVTYIGNGAFSGCTGLINLTIPDSVTYIGEAAFSGCAGLTSVYIPNNVIKIERGVFLGCTELRSIYIPDSVAKIGDWAFQKCVGLTSVNIPDSVIEIGNGAFRECTRLKNVNIPDSVTKIGHLAFEKCTGLTKVSIPAKAKVDFGAFPVIPVRRA